MALTRLSNARVDQLLQQAREPAFWLSAGRRLLWVNRAWEALTGHPASSAVGLVCQAHGPTRAGDLAGLGGSFYPPAEALAGRPAGARTLIIHASGERLWRRVDYWPFHAAEGEVAYLLGLVREPEEPALAAESETQHLRQALLEVRDRAIARYGSDALVGRGPAHRRLLDQVAAASGSAGPILIVGEPGTGKRLVARTIHTQGPRRNEPFVSLDSAALPAEILRRELFVAGEASDVGGETRLRFPAGSTLVIGGVADLPRDLQGGLVAALDSGVRLIATTAVDPDLARQSERLRTDLYYALTAIVIRLAPLRERLDELPLLAQSLLERLNQRGGRQRGGFTEAAVKALIEYDWPGNLRELAAVIESAHGRGTLDPIDADDLPADIRGHLASSYVPPAGPPPVVPLDDLLTQVERRLIESTLIRVRHNKSRAAERLGISRPRLYRRIKELGLPDVPEAGDEANGGGA